MRTFFLSISAIVMLTIVSCNVANHTSKEQLADYVDTKIGVIDTRGSNCVIGPQLPYGSINPSPQTKDGDMDGYHPQQPIRGFTQLSVSGTGWGKYSHFLISPQVGFAVGQEGHDSPKSDEVTKAYYYAVNLDRYQIRAEVAPAHNSAIYRFTYPNTDSAYVVLDATQCLKDIVAFMDKNFHQCKVEINPVKNQVNAMIEFTGGWAGGPYKMFFIAKFNKPFAESGVWKDKELKKGQGTLSLEAKSDKRLGAFLRFKTVKAETVLMKVAISFSSYEHAERFLADEIPLWDIEKVKDAGKNAWNKKLELIKIETTSDDQRKILYTAYYHTLLQPRNRTGDNPKWQNVMPYWDDNYALWDTWRTSYPLLVLIDPDVVRDNIICFLDRYKHNGNVRDAFVAGNDMDAEQGGNDVDNVIVDAYVKGIQGVDWSLAYEFLKHNAENERKGLPISLLIDKGADTTNAARYKELGWIPAGMMSSSLTLEYNYNDFCVAQLAKGLGYTADYEKYMKRCNGWTSLWNENLESENYTGFIDAKKANQIFLNMDAKQYGGSWSLPFYEGSSWTYSYFVPHDIPQLIKLMGGKEKFVERLEHALNNNLIDYGNEPAFLALRTFNHAGRPDLTSKWAHSIMKNNYDLTGYTGNDDTGAMSSWYIFSAIGFFPNAGQDIYYLNAPLYAKSELTLGNGKKLSIISSNASESNIYIKSCRINGKQWHYSIINHSDIANGGTIEFELTDAPTDWGKN